MNPRPKIKDEFKRTVIAQVRLTEKEATTLDALVTEYKCRDRSDFFRKAAFGEIKVDPRKIKK